MFICIYISREREFRLHDIPVEELVIVLLFRTGLNHNPRKMPKATVHPNRESIKIGKHFKHHPDIRQHL